MNMLNCWRKAERLTIKTIFGEVPHLQCGFRVDELSRRFTFGYLHAASPTLRNEYLLTRNHGAENPQSICQYLFRFAGLREFL